MNKSQYIQLWIKDAQSKHQELEALNLNPMFVLSLMAKINPQEFESEPIEVLMKCDEFNVFEEVMH
jgi:hypothetical protein